MSEFIVISIMYITYFKVLNIIRFGDYLLSLILENQHLVASTFISVIDILNIVSYIVLCAHIIKGL